MQALVVRMGRGLVAEVGGTPEVATRLAFWGPVNMVFESALSHQPARLPMASAQ